jgi:hypothetical protein
MFRWVLWTNCQVGVHWIPELLKRTSSGDAFTSWLEAMPNSQTVFKQTEPVTASIKLSTWLNVIADEMRARIEIKVTKAIVGHGNRPSDLWRSGGAWMGGFEAR